MVLTRRRFLTLAAPAIVIAANIMPVRVWEAIEPKPASFVRNPDLHYRWANVTQDGRAAQLEMAGYRFVHGTDRVVNAEGDIVRLAYIPRELYEDRQAAKEAEISAIERQILAG